MFAPAGTPRDIVQRLNTESVKALADPGFKQKFLVTAGIETGDSSRCSADQFAQFIKADRLAYEEVAKAVGIEKRQRPTRTFPPPLAGEG
jgi:tripartite-type tricarboxylate transporter receptor subunit TctC